MYCFGCGIDVKSGDRRALDNAEANDVVVVWPCGKAFLADEDHRIGEDVYSVDAILNGEDS